MATSRKPKRKVIIHPLAEQTVASTPISEPKAAIRSQKISLPPLASASLNHVTTQVTIVIPARIKMLNHLLNTFSVISSEVEKSIIHY